MQMHNSGAPLTEIRPTIDRKYGPSFPTTTPTPRPPTSGGFPES
jgi:hypothetical protein